MYSEEHKLYLKKIKRKKVLITVTQLLILIILRMEQNMININLAI